MASNIRQALIAKIHIGKKALCLDDATYRDVLQMSTGKTSCEQMNLQELKKVLETFKRQGFVPKPAQDKTAKYGKKPHTTADRQALMDKIEAMLTDSGLHWNYAHAMAEKMFGVSFVNWLDATDLYKLTQALAVYQKRRADGKSKNPKK